MSWHAEYFRERGDLRLEDYISRVFGDPVYNYEQRLYRLCFNLNFGEFSKQEILAELEAIRLRATNFLDGEIDYIKHTEFDE